MSRLRVFFFALSWFPLWVSAQTYTTLSASEQSAVLSALSQDVRSMQCSFRQEKKSSLLAEKAVSKGMLYFKAPLCMRWEYTNPQQLVLLMKGNVFQTQTAEGVGPANRGFQGLGRLIVGILTGNELQNGKNFQTVVQSNGSLYRIEMKPLNSRMKGLFTEIVLYVQQSTMNAVHIQMNEVGGDVTDIYFSNVKKNLKLGDALFELK